MKSKTIKGISRHPEGLTFAWLRGDESLVRFWVALVLAVLIFVGGWFAIRIRVPAAMAPDSQRVEKAQLLMMNAESHPSLQALLENQRLPSLGVGESVGEVPLVADVLQQLGLAEEVQREIILYQAPVSKLVLDWPVEEKLALAMPKLPEPAEELWPSWEGAPARQWSVGIVARGAESEALAEVSLPWSEVLPAEKMALWSLIFDERGELAYAHSVADFAKEDEMRKLLQRFFSRGDVEMKLALGSFAGVVALQFEQMEQSEP